MATCSSAALRTGNRRYIYCTCSAVLALCGGAMAAFSYWKDFFLSTHSLLGFLPLVIVITMFMAHGFGINSVLHLLTGEVFPTKVLYTLTYKTYLGSESIAL